MLDNEFAKAERERHAAESDEARRVNTVLDEYNVNPGSDKRWRYPNASAGSRMEGVFVVTDRKRGPYEKQENNIVSYVPGYVKFQEIAGSNAFIFSSDVVLSSILRGSLIEVSDNDLLEI